MHIHTYVHTYIHTYIHTYVHTYICSMYVHTYVHMYICSMTYSMVHISLYNFRLFQLWDAMVYMCECMYVYICTYLRTHVCTYVYRGLSRLLILFSLSVSHAHTHITEYNCNLMLSALGGEVICKAIGLDMQDPQRR